MSVSTLFWRPINLLRSREVRANSKHTSLSGLNNIYTNPRKANASNVVSNIARRILTGQIKMPTWSSYYGRLLTNNELTRISAELLEKAAAQCGIPDALGKTLKELQLHAHPIHILNGLGLIAQHSSDTKVLSLLCRNNQSVVITRQDIRENGGSISVQRNIFIWFIAALNPNTPGEAVATALCNVPKEKVPIKWETVSDINIDNYEVLDTYNRPIRWKYSYAQDTLDIAKEIFEVHKTERILIMGRIQKLNPALYAFLCNNINTH